MAIVLNILIVVFGVIGFKFLGVRDYPAIDPPNINVRTSYPGANPDIIESQITEPLEKAINGIAGVKNITSSSNAGASNINVEFELGIDLEAAANDGRDMHTGAGRHVQPQTTGRDIQGITGGGHVGRFGQLQHGKTQEQMRHGRVADDACFGYLRALGGRHSSVGA